MKIPCWHWFPSIYSMGPEITKFWCKQYASIYAFQWPKHQTVEPESICAWARRKPRQAATHNSLCLLNFI